MIAAHQPSQRPPDAKLLVVGSGRDIRHAPRTSFVEYLRPGDVVVATQPEQVSALHYYLPDGLRYATLTGWVPDVGVTDWRDGVERLERTSAARDLAPVLDSVPPGGRVAVVVPQVYSLNQWRAPWTSLVRERSEEWLAHLEADTRFTRTDVEPVSPEPRPPNPVRAEVFVRR